MYKELVICIVVVILVVIGNVVTQNNTTKSVAEVSGSLAMLREEMIKKDINQEKCAEYMKNSENIWKKKFETMAYYIEHTELEKVQTELTKLKADIDVEEYHTGVENLDNCIFILEHIKDKSALKVVNIF